MARDQKETTLKAFRAYLPDDIEIPLQAILERIRETLPEHEERVAGGANLFDRIVLSEFKTAPANFALGAVFSTYEPGAKTSTLDFQASNSTLGQGEKAADEGEEFLGKNVSILVEGNHVVACGIANKANVVMQAILDIARHAGVITSTAVGRISEVPHNPTVDDIIEHGVSSISLNATNMLASLPSLEKQGFIAKFFSPAPGVPDHELKRSVTANLSINNKKLDYELAPKEDWINELAIMTMEDTDVSSYRIVLGNGDKISAKSLFLNKKVNVKWKAQTFDLEHAHLLMIAYLGELKENGLIT